MRHRDPEAERARKAASYAANRDTIREKQRAYRVENREILRAQAAAHRARLRQLAIEKAIALPVPLCECGCGLPVTITPQTTRKAGRIAGQPCRFRKGHHPKSTGRYVDSSGYVKVRKPAGGGYMYEHILIAEKAVGHALPKGAEVHHVDENRSNNANGNLVVCQDRAYHQLLHRRMRRLRRAVAA